MIIILWIILNVFYSFSAVFVFCVAILLAVGVNASPVIVDDVEIALNDIVEDPLVVEGVVESVQDFKEDDEVKVEESDPVENVQENDVEEEPEVINETVEIEAELPSEDEVAAPSEVEIPVPSDELGVPYQEEGREEEVKEDEVKEEEEIDGKALQSESEPELSQDDKERFYGLNIPACFTHHDTSVTLHVR